MITLALPIYHETDLLHIRYKIPYILAKELKVHTYIHSKQVEVERVSVFAANNAQ